MNYNIGDFPVTERIANTCLSLPIWPGMDAVSTDIISSIINKYKY